MLAHPLLPKLKQLRLSGIALSLEERAALAAATGVSHVDFLALLLDDELERRQQNRHQLRIRRAGFDDVRLISQFDFGAVPTLDRSLVLSMATCQFVQNKENWIICGQTGTGKSHLAAGIGYEAIKKGYTVLWKNTAELLLELADAREDGVFQRRLKALIDTELLILDDFGLKPVSPQGGQDLYDIVHKRYEHGSIVVTSNRALTEWDDIFGDGLLASAALDRLTHHARITVVKGGSYRQKSRTNNTASTKEDEPTDKENL
jgi:DNA replication protein DnaC